MDRKCIIINRKCWIQGQEHNQIYEHMPNHWNVCMLGWIKDVIYIFRIQINAINHLWPVKEISAVVQRTQWVRIKTACLIPELWSGTRTPSAWNVQKLTGCINFACVRAYIQRNICLRWSLLLIVVIEWELVQIKANQNTCEYSVRRKSIELIMDQV